MCLVCCTDAEREIPETVDLGGAFIQYDVMGSKLTHQFSMHLQIFTHMHCVEAVVAAQLLVHVPR